jgi:hypothetical protein
MQRRVILLFVLAAHGVDAFLSQPVLSRNPVSSRATATICLRMDGTGDGGGFGGLAKGLGNWMSNQVKANMGKLEIEQEKVRQTVVDDDSVKPDFSFKFANKFSEKLEQVSCCASMDQQKSARARAHTHTHMRRKMIASELFHDVTF